MTRLGKTIARLASLKMAPASRHARARDRFADMTGFGANPGALRARTYLPDDLPIGAPLVVVLHGCTQNAAAYDHGAGWSQLADELGFALLFPEQQRANNPNLCFNWFSSADATRDRGEALSIRQMVDALVSAHALDPNRIFVTGLSAGGAMASTMLAAYPELFAGGAIIAGLPFSGTDSLGDALARMRGRGYPSDAALGALVRAASPHDGRWPRVSVWHGSADNVVHPSNADRIVGQWLTVRGIVSTPRRDMVDGFARRSWSGDDGRVAVEAYDITGMGHGTPLDTTEPDGCGAQAAHMLDVGISSTRHIARFWGLAGGEAAAGSERAERLRASGSKAPVRQPVPPEPMQASRVVPTTSVGTIIEDALRAAGLMR